MLVSGEATVHCLPSPHATGFSTLSVCLSVCRYMITNLDRTHAGFYRCIVRNRMGALLQRQTEVQVACEYPRGCASGRVPGGI